MQSRTPNRKARRAAAARYSTGHRKSASGGRPAQANYIGWRGVCPPGAPCCAAIEADRAFFASEPTAKTLLRERIIGEFGDLDARAEQLYGPRFLVVVVRLDKGRRTRQPITRADANELARQMDLICERGQA
jgi:hypothetical protein